jgi:hypothetical protein
MIDRDEDTPHFSSFIKEPSTDSPKVDGVIIYALSKLTTIASRPYTNQTDRSYKYYQIRDLIFVVLDPLIAPKIRTRTRWVELYKEYMDDLKREDRLQESEEYFVDTIQKMNRLLASVLYTNGYYFTESISDREYVDIMASGAKIGAKNIL